MTPNLKSTTQRDKQMALYGHALPYSQENQIKPSTPPKSRYWTARNARVDQG